ncbi:hypothetical protein CYMTET_17421 [Cymbomonas tetramitiformis]|uniref:Uncharacterized protein n=1 Tax=Cymbomonas tetramitiformis TaxID=36881 RepID=A0AAE0GAD6_9CHLO|nr:hypothetical protein CYMTET_17421 [Cymbomonas tetramitiformis]
MRRMLPAVAHGSLRPPGVWDSRAQRATSTKKAEPDQPPKHSARATEPKAAAAKLGGKSAPTPSGAAAAEAPPRQRHPSEESRTAKMLSAPRLMVPGKALLFLALRVIGVIGVLLIKVPGSGITRVDLLQTPPPSSAAESQRLKEADALPPAKMEDLDPHQEHAARALLSATPCPDCNQVHNERVAALSSEKELLAEQFRELKRELGNKTAAAALELRGLHAQLEDAEKQCATARDELQKRLEELQEELARLYTAKDTSEEAAQTELMMEKEAAMEEKIMEAQSIQDKLRLLELECEEKGKAAASEKEQWISRVEEAEEKMKEKMKEVQSIQDNLRVVEAECGEKDTAAASEKARLESLVEGTEERMLETLAETQSIRDKLRVMELNCDQKDTNGADEKEQLESRVKEVEEQCKESNAIVLVEKGELQGQLEQLQAELDQSASYQKETEKTANTEIQQLQSMLRAVEGEVQEKNQAMQLAQESLAELRAELDQVRTSQTGAGTYNPSVSASWRAQLDSLQSRLEDVQNTLKGKEGFSNKTRQLLASIAYSLLTFLKGAKVLEVVKKAQLLWDMSGKSAIKVHLLTSVVAIAASKLLPWLFGVITGKSARGQLKRHSKQVEDAVLSPSSRSGQPTSPSAAETMPMEPLGARPRTTSSTGACVIPDEAESSEEVRACKRRVRELTESCSLLQEEVDELTALIEAIAGQDTVLCTVPELEEMGEKMLDASLLLPVDSTNKQKHAALQMACGKFVEKLTGGASDETEDEEDEEAMEPDVEKIVAAAVNATGGEAALHGLNRSASVGRRRSVINLMPTQALSAATERRLSINATARVSSGAFSRMQLTRARTYTAGALASAASGLVSTELRELSEKGAGGSGSPPNRQELAQLKERLQQETAAKEEMKKESDQLREEVDQMMELVLEVSAPETVICTIEDVQALGKRILEVDHRVCLESSAAERSGEGEEEEEVVEETEAGDAASQTSQEADGKKKRRPSLSDALPEISERLERRLSVSNAVVSSTMRSRRGSRASISGKPPVP